MTPELARDVFEIFAVALGATLAAIGYAVSTERRIRADYQSQLDAAFAEIRELKAQVGALTRMLDARGMGLTINAGGDATIGGDAVGRDKG